MAELIDQPVQAPQKEVANSAPSNNNSQNTQPPNQANQNPPDKPIISTVVLFIGSLFVAFVLIIFSIFYLKINFVTFPQPTQVVRQGPSPSPSPEVTKTSQNTLPVVPGWKIYTSSEYSYSFQYPSEFRLGKGTKGTQLLEKISVFDSNHSSPEIKILVWDNASSSLPKDAVEDWCFQTLKEEARQENLLCPFMSSAALNDTDIAGYPAFTTNYYNSDQEKIDFYILPLSTKIITAQAFTFLDHTKNDDGSSQAKNILKTVSLQ